MVSNAQPEGRTRTYTLCTTQTQAVSWLFLPAPCRHYAYFFLINSSAQVSREVLPLHPPCLPQCCQACCVLVALLPAPVLALPSLAHLADLLQGPFLPSYLPPSWHWTHAFLVRFQGAPEVHAVSSSLVCLPVSRPSGSVAAGIGIAVAGLPP
jgi:hypothetical protein